MIKVNIKKNLEVVKNKFEKNKKYPLLHQIHSNKFIYISKDSKINKKKLRLMPLLLIKKNYRLVF